MDFVIILYQFFNSTLFIDNFVKLLGLTKGISMRIIAIRMEMSLLLTDLDLFNWKGVGCNKKRLNEGPCHMSRGFFGQDLG